MPLSSGATMGSMGLGSVLSENYVKTSPLRTASLLVGVWIMFYGS